MDFKNASELLALCTQQQLPISEIMRRRECQLGETTRDEVTHRMKKALEIMRSSALTPLKTPVKSMGGLIGGEAKKLAQHAAKGHSMHKNCKSRNPGFYRKSHMFLSILFIIYLFFPSFFCTCFALYVFFSF